MTAGAQHVVYTVQSKLPRARAHPRTSRRTPDRIPSLLGIPAPPCPRRRRQLPRESSSLVDFREPLRNDGSARKLEARLPLYCTHCTLPMPFHAERVTCNHPHRAALVRARPGEEGWAAVRVSDCQQQRHAGTPAHGLTHPLLHFRTCGNSSWTTPKT